jgi:cellobiose phosphorylase
MGRLERYRGHFYNWYDTQSLLPLMPAYVSSVDSGNLAGHLLTLRAGLVELADRPVLPEQLWQGLADSVAVLIESLTTPAPTALTMLRTTVDQYTSVPPADLHHALEKLAAQATAIAAELFDAAGIGVMRYADALVAQTTDFAAEARTFVPAAAERMPSLSELAQGGHAAALERLAQLDALQLRAVEFATPDWSFLYDRDRHLLAIGYNVYEIRRDASFYDLLASEARLAVFVGIAQGQLEEDAWFALGRLLTRAGGQPILLSWSGSMFEYLMPMLVMPVFEDTLLDQTGRAAVLRQIEYGRSRGVPWGISESGYNTVDAHQNYQYRAFGVPGLGLQRGLAEDLVIAPYASALALMVEPEAACANLMQMASRGYLGQYGFYEAIDYTAARLRPGQTEAVVRSYMAHHQGMSLLALDQVLLDRPMQRRFESDPGFQATLLLLQERIPRATAQYSNNPELVDLRVNTGGPELPVRVFTHPDSSFPAVQLLSNGRYHVMLTHTGGGYSRWKDLALTRWREDTTRDHWGSFCYLHDVDSGSVWSTAYAPTGRGSQGYAAIFTEARVEYQRRDAEFDTHTEIVVSPEDDIELRRTRVTNRTRSQRTLDITSFAEIVLAPAIADAMHPAFSNLFVQTELLVSRDAILCTRRPRSKGEAVPWFFHLLCVHDSASGKASFETDRNRFIGRGRSPRDPSALHSALSNSQGSVLDPIVAIRQRLVLEALQSSTFDRISGVAASREAALALIDKYQDRHFGDRVFEMAWTHSHVVMRQLNVTEADAQLYGRLASSILYANGALRAEPSVIARNRRGQNGLWGYSISGDLPIVLLQIKDGANIDLVRQLVQAHAYWRGKGLSVDLVIWNEDRGGYRQVLQDQIMGLIAAGVEASFIDRPGGIFVRSAEQISNEDRILLRAVSRAIFTDGGGTLAEQIKRKALVELPMPKLVPTRMPVIEEPVLASPTVGGNGIGAFSADGREYVIQLKAGRTTPAPWVNVLANRTFGSVISETGAAYTWQENAHEYRLSPWHNDPVSDPSGEALYLRDEETGRYWSPTPAPRRGHGDYRCRHGFGYSVFEHTEDGIQSELWVYVAIDAQVKYSVLKLRNESGRARQLSATAYVEWVLGDLRGKTAMHITSEVDPQSGALFARNPYNPEFSEQIAFLDVDDQHRSFTCDRAEFIGRNRDLKHPAALARTRLSGRVGAALDPCAAIQVPFELGDGQTREIIVRLGVGRGPDDTTRLVQNQRRTGCARAALAAVHAYWTRTLGVIQIETPDAGLNAIGNGWLLYQTLACRMWARSGFYQSGGAFGFRDQLQDSMATLHADPGQTRAHLLLCASRQFLEGDVQHWWHPPSGRGVRTRCSDDFLWLPLATCRYVTLTGDHSVLDENAPFLDGRAVGPEEESYYDLPLRVEDSASLYQHCVRAVEHGLHYGVHGLPLMGAGDWNDGMNNVGIHGHGESVWLGFFLYQVLLQFAELAVSREDDDFASRCRSEALRLRENLALHGWDGAWFRRAYYDDGTPLGTATADECQIDSIAQSWSVLSGAADPERQVIAMRSLDQRLVRRDARLIQLLDPPFDRSPLDPGYIRGYVPGVRENGGQYTHAAVWATMAFAALGDVEKAWELLDLINPVNHATTPQEMQTYAAEPYVLAGDVYAVAPHTGRGGWSWYTGSAGWMYRLIVESLLGVRREASRLYLEPRLRAAWPGYALSYRYGATRYAIEVKRDPGVTGLVLEIDGVERSEAFIELVDDGVERRVLVRVG